MTDDPTDPEASEPSADDRLDESLEACLAELETAHSGAGKMKAFRREQSAVEDFIDAVAGVVADGLGQHQVSPHLDAVAEAAAAYNKTALKEALDERVDELEREGDDGRVPLDAFVEQRLREVTVVRTTDEKQDTVWRWTFGDFTLETGTTKDGIEHFSWQQFRDEIYKACGELPAGPSHDLKDGGEWKEWVTDLIDRRGHETETRGARTIAVDALRDFIRGREAYGNLEDVVIHSSVYLDVDPDEGDPDEIWVPNNHIKRICDEKEITPRALQVELDARTLLADRVSGASEQQTLRLNGNRRTVTYWVLDARIADPADYEAEASTPAELAERDDPTEVVDDQEGESAGLVGSVSGGGGDGDE